MPAIANLHRAELVCPPANQRGILGGQGAFTEDAIGALNQLFQGVLMAVDPVLHARFAVISLCEDVGQPDRGQPAIADPLVMTVVAQMMNPGFRADAVVAPAR